MTRRRSALAAIVIVLAAGAPAAASPLTLERALALAVERHPSLAGARARIAGSTADVDLVDAERVPSLGATARYGLGASQPAPIDEPVHDAGLDLTAIWNLWDFGHRAARRDAAVAEVTVRQRELTQDERAVLQRVELAYSTVLGAHARATVADSAVAAERRHLDEVERFLAAGTRTAIDVAQARARLAQAVVTQVRAESAIATARADLERAIGTTLPAEVELASGWPGPVAGEDATIEVLLAEAVRASPELAVVGARRRALELARTGTRRSTRPVLSASALGGVDLLDRDPLLPEGDRGALRWSVGLALTWQFFDGGARNARLRGADAGLREVDAERGELELELRYQVEVARLGVTSAKAEQVAVAASLAAASEQLRVAEARFSAGLGTSTELADAQDALTLAQGDEADANLELALARATLRHLLGRLSAS